MLWDKAERDRFVLISSHNTNACTFCNITFYDRWVETESEPELIHQQCVLNRSAAHYILKVMIGLVQNGFHENIILGK